MKRTEKKKNNIKKKNNTKKKKKFSFKMFLAFIIFEVIFTGVTGPFMLYYGPFQSARNTIVGAAMTTLTHQWIATAFLSDDRINEILDKSKIQDIVQDDTEEENIKIKDSHDNTIERYDVEVPGSNFKGYLLVIHNPKRVRIGHSSKLGKVGETTSKIAKRYKAVAAVNAGGFTDESTNGKQLAGNGGRPRGIIMSKGEMIFNDYKDDDVKDDIVAITKEGRLLVGKHTVRELKEKGVKEAVSFGPALIVNGKKTLKNGNDGGWGKAPRTAIGQRKDGSILLLVLDGKQIKRLAATLKDVQDVLYEYGAYNASNLDGGSSTTMYYNGKVINEPCNALGERSIPSVIYVEP